LFDKTRPPVASLISNNATTINVLPDSASRQPVESKAAATN